MSDSNVQRIKGWAIAASGFCICLALLDVVWTRVVINGSATSEAARIGHLLRENGSEIPIFGASKAHAAYVSEVLGDDVFNYGLDAASLDVVNALLEIECKKAKQSPIVLDMNHFAFHGAGDPSKFAPFAWRPEIREMLGRLGLMEWRYWVPGLRYFGYYDWFLKDYLAEHFSVTKKTVRGYTQAFNASPFSRHALDDAIRKRLEAGWGFRCDSDQDRRLFNHIKSTPQRTWILVYSPLHSSCFVNFQDFEGFARYLDKLRSFPNVVVLDWSRMNFSDELFFDTTHLNVEGAHEFSRRFAVRLGEICQAAQSGAQGSTDSGVPGFRK